MFSRRHLFYGLAGLVLCALLALDAAAGKGNGKGKPGGGGGEDPLPAGTIYFNSEGLGWTMDPDGGNKTPLPADVRGEPSYDLHGGHRWFMQNRAVGGEGQQLFAVREDGDMSFTVRLTTDPDLRKAVVGWARWSKDDTRISWHANRLESGSVVESGIYVADILFDSNGNVEGLDAQPLLAIELNFGSGGDHDWAPDGTKIVYAHGGLHVADLVGGGSTFLASGDQPAWSPDGATIAFQAGDGIYTIGPDGSGATRVINAGSPNGPNATFVAVPRWAPTSSHLIYYRAPRSIENPDPGEIWRATAGGKGKVNLTADIGPDASPMAWR